MSEHRTPQGKLKSYTYEMTRYNWHVIGLHEVRSKDFGETTTREGHKIYYSGKENKHEHGVGCLSTKPSWVLSWVAVQFLVDSSLFDSGQALSTSPSCKCMPQQQAMTITKSKHSTISCKKFWMKRQKKVILIVQGDWNAKIEKEASKD